MTTPARTGIELNALMEFDHVVYSDGNGNVTDNTAYAPAMPDRYLWAPQPYVDLDADGQMVSLKASDIHDLDGWHLLDGFSGQYGYGGPIMHPSEYVGGGLETHIRENAGYYVVVEIHGYGLEHGEHDEVDEEPVGWAVAFKAEHE